MTTLSQIISAALMQSLWQDAIVALALWIALKILKAHSPQLRYLASCAALTMMVLWPVASSVSAVATPTASSAGATSQSAAPAPPIVDAPGASRSGLSIVTLVQSSSIAPLQQWALPIWIVGVMLFSLRAVGAGAHAFVLARRSTRADTALHAQVEALARRMRIFRRVHVRISPLTTGPATLGALRPVLLVPSAALIGLTSQQLEAVIAHELAHIRRHDYVVNLMQVLVETLGFYHPAIWWVSAHIRVERELCCDDLALRSHGDPISYAQALTALAKMRVALPRLALGVATGSLLYRVQRVLGVATDLRQTFPWSALLALSLVVGLAAIHPGAIRAQAADRAASLSGFVYDPFGGLVAGLPLTIEAGPFQPAHFGHTVTDASGHFVFEHLPAGSFVLTAPVSDFVHAQRVEIDRGASVERDIHMAIETLTGEIIVCATCAPDPIAYELPPSLAEEFRRDREASAAAPVLGPAPRGGWEFDRPHVYPYPASLQASIEGTVIVTGHISSDGRPIWLHAVSSSLETLSAAAVEIVGEQRWDPARVRGVAVDVPLRMTVRFMRARQ